jgi:hypothetical protein
MIRDGNFRLTDRHGFTEVPFEPENGDEYLAFFITRKY